MHDCHCPRVAFQKQDFEWGHGKGQGQHGIPQFVLWRKQPQKRQPEKEHEDKSCHQLRPQPGATARNDEMVVSQPKTNANCLMTFFNIRAVCCTSTWGSSITQIWHASRMEKSCKVYKEQLSVSWSDKRVVRGPQKEAMERPDYLSEESKVLEANADRQQPKPFCELLLNKNSPYRKTMRITTVLSKMKMIKDFKKALGRADEDNKTAEWDCVAWGTLCEWEQVKQRVMGRTVAFWWPQGNVWRDRDSVHPQHGCRSTTQQDT